VLCPVVDELSVVVEVICSDVVELCWTVDEL
jgi:hypothetical protein